MASRHGLHVKFNAVIKGYRVFRNRMNDSLTYVCVPDSDNVFDKEAVMVKCVENGTCIGHVPATPVKINKAVLDILELDPSIKVQWPHINPNKARNHGQPLHKKGGGAITPATYTIYAPNWSEQKILQILHGEASKDEDILKIMSIMVERSGELTPPMHLSDRPGLPDTPKFKDYTP